MYPNMTQLLSPAKQGDFELSKFEVKNDFFSAYHNIAPGHYVKLSYQGQVVMSNTPMEQRTNRHFVCHAHGDILIGGLGIGMIIMAIQNKEDVKSITVLEKNAEVIQMVASQLDLNEKVRIIQADVFSWKPAKSQRFDCIYMDIWPAINYDIYRREMVPLKRRYGHYLKAAAESPNRFNACWAEWNAKTGHPLI